MAVETSILKSIKRLLGIADDYKVFDPELIIFINSQFSVLHNIGAAPPAGFMITGEEEVWSSFLGDVHKAEMVKTYIYVKVRMLFDPPANAFVMTAFQEQAKELEWRLNTMEFDFDPSAKPIITPQENYILSQLQDDIETLEERVEDLDDENNVPDLTTIFQSNLED